MRANKEETGKEIENPETFETSGNGENLKLHLKSGGVTHNKFINLTKFHFRAELGGRVYDSLDENSENVWLSPGKKRFKVSPSGRFILCYDSLSFSVVKFCRKAGFKKVFEYQRTSNFLVKQVEFFENKAYFENLEKT